MLEKQVEERLRKRVKEIGGLALKFVSPGHSGVPDRIVFLPKGRIYLVELKAPGRKLTKLQNRTKKQFEKLGFTYYVISSYEEVEEFINAIHTA